MEVPFFYALGQRRGGNYFKNRKLETKDFNSLITYAMNFIHGISYFENVALRVVTFIFIFYIYLF